MRARVRGAKNHLSGDLNSRRIAAEILTDVTDEHRTLDEALRLSKDLGKLSDSDRGFVRAMLGAALRDRGRIDSAIQKFLEKPLRAAPAPARALLRLGAAQAWLLNTPRHAVVSEAVDAAKSWDEAQGVAGLLNAVLRKVVDARDVFEERPLKENWPAWLWSDFEAGLGSAAANRLLEAQQRQPELHLSPKDLSASELAGLVGGHPIGLDSVAIPPQAVEAIAGFEAGIWWVQDAAAALPAKLLKPKPGERIADICAAPGGKTLQLIAAGADVTAVDRSRPRLAKLKANLKRMQLSAAEIVEAKAEEWAPSDRFDKILLDAPCSALGTLRRHPEGAWNKSAKDVAGFPDVQKRLLKAALSNLKPGGELIYCVCSPRPVEGRDVISDILQETGVSRQPFQADEVGPFSSSITLEGDLLTIPDSDFDHDAFFISRLFQHA